MLDAVDRGSGPGSVHHLASTDEIAAHRCGGAHEGNAGELLAVARLVGDLPPVVEVVGIQPAEVSTGVGLSGPVREALEPAAATALEVATRLLADLPARRKPCTS